MDYSIGKVIAVDVGSRLRQLRKERGKSMRAVARDSGLSTNALSMIERGRTSPSVSTLNKISTALGIPITAFFREEPSKTDVVFCQANERKRVVLSTGVWEGMGGESFSGNVEPFILTLEIGAESSHREIIHSGHEFVLCIEGQIEYEVEEQSYLLNAGDSLTFAAQLRHRWRNPGISTTKVLIVLTGFAYGERPSEYHILSNILKE